MEVNTNTEDAKLIKKLQRALYYETQYRNAIVSNSLSFYDANLTKDIVESDFFYMDQSGNLVSIPEKLGLKIPCKFSELQKRVYIQLMPETSKKKIHNVDNINQVLIDTYNSGKRDYTIEYWAEVFSGRKLFLNQRYLLTKNEAGDICALSIIKDYTESRTEDDNKTQNELEQYAYFDPVTNGYNYIKFKEEVHKLAIPGVIVSLDIHSFKVINTICGIARGDQVIKCIWENILNVLDIDQNDIAGHINADHYIIFLPTTDKDVIIRKIKNISLSLSMISTELSVPQIQPYYGVSNWNPGEKIELAYSEAVAAKHNAKDQQSANFAFFEEADTKRLVEEKRIVDAFEEALAKRQFKIWYQPKFDPLNHKLVGAEALVRWVLDDGTMISPGAFIPVYEKNSMIRILDEYIFRNLCMTQKKWLNEGKNIVPVSVNLSRASLYYHEIVEQYKHIAGLIGIDPKYTPIEITESAAITNNQIKEIADRFYESGFTLHMDDFGSGYSSLASLNTMHFDTLKLDKSLIDFIGNFSGDRLIEHTICLANELGMHVTAEGVETSTQVEFLKHTGCDSIQGYYYSKPIPQKDFEKMLMEYQNEPEMSESAHLDTHIAQFNQSFIKPPLYTFTVNLSQNSYYSTTETRELDEETKVSTLVYSEVIDQLAGQYISLEYRDAYKNLMDRDKLLSNFTGMEETRIFNYTRQFKGNTEKMRMLLNIFTIPNSTDVWMYISVSKI
ncbi:EAL domain-containing protein [Treponema sp.]|uniref:EAL domain-containing protein n=1 Tax=Treponema sp. TaxID=166 RepID=UPI00298EC23B|nr:EAL domain-containing protein [Treponema sp.]MCQ2242321.1 EAL domain-containing protein [Treponema sp.]